jgi:hypothetical protein
LDPLDLVLVARELRGNHYQIALFKAETGIGAKRGE